MPTDSAQYRITGRNAATLTRSIERGVVLGRLRPGDTLPSVRGLATDLQLSPTTVAAAYRDLRQRGVLVSHDRSRTVVAHRPPLAVRVAADVPEDAVDLATGNPDPQLLPDLGPRLAAIAPSHRLYGEPAAVDALLDTARESFLQDGVTTDHLTVVGGGLDGIERVLQVHCRVGDRIAVEDPAYIGSLDLLRTLGLVPVPVAVDDDGPEPGSLAEALERGVEAILVNSRAQNPTGATLSAERAGALRQVLGGHPDVLLVEDDHAGLVNTASFHHLGDDRPRWATIRSVAKSLGPDLRVGVISSDEDTAARVAGRQRLGTGWVSHLLQRLTADVWATAVADGTLDRATATYARRRAAVVDALASHGITTRGTSGFNVWVPVVEEVPVVQGLAVRGWAVQAGEPFRLDAGPAIRLTVAALETAEAAVLADDLADVLGQRLDTRRG